MLNGRLIRGLVATLAAFAAAASGATAQVPGYDPDASPPGANDFGCVPSAAHPDPVVLVHGLGATAQANWGYMSPRIKAAGYCVFALTYGRTTTNPPPFDELGGTLPMEESSKQLAAFVDRVLAATGAARVDVVGHSEGSLMPDYYLRFMPEGRAADGTPKVARYVGMTPLWDGTRLASPGPFPDLLGANGCGSCPEFLHGSAFLNRMNAGTGPRVDGVAYTMLMTRNDELVLPYTSGVMAGAANIVVQDQCALDPSEHGALAVDPIALRDVLNALDPAHAQPVSCATYLSAR